MDSQRWQAVRAALDEALGLAPPERAAWLARLEANDPALAREVAALLERDTTEDGPHASPVAEPLGALFGAPSLAPGTRLGAYEVRELLASGGMGSVYRAERADAEFEKSVAIKLIKRGMDSGDILRRFRYERQVLAGLEHPGIARLVDGGASDDGQPFLVMEYVEGAPIDEWCDDRRATVEERLRLFQQVCRAVHYAHQHLVVHRDLKPSNILVTPEGRTKLLDFGVAKVLASEDDPERSQWTQGQGFFGTPAFASPEQASGEHVTTASDVYSLGVVLYVLLTGRRPHELSRASSAEVRRILCERDPPAPSATLEPSAESRADAAQTERTERAALARGSTRAALRAHLVGDLDNIVLTALRREPERRYGTAEELAEDIQRHLDDLPVQARPSTFGYLATKFVARHRASVAIGVALLLSLVGGILLTSNYYLEASRSSEEASRRYEDVRALASQLIFRISGDMGPLEGSVAARERIARAGLESLDRLASESRDDPRLMLELGNAYLCIGDVLGGALSANLGRREEASRSYDQALGIARELRAAADPEPDALDLLAQALMRRGDMQRLEGDSGASIERYLEALDLGSQAGEPDARQALRAAVLERLGDVRFERGDHERALERRGEVLALREGLAEASASDAAQRSLAVAHGKLSRSLSRMGRWDEAEAHVREACERLTRFIEGGEDDAELRSQYAAAHFDLGLLCHQQGRSDEALEPLVLARELRLAQAVADPRDVAAQRRLALNQQVLGDVLHKLRRLEEALLMQEESLETKRRLLRLDPKNAGYRRDVAMGLTLLGGLYLGQGDLDRAEPLLEEAREAFEALAAADLESAEAKRDLVAIFSNLGAYHMSGANDRARALGARHAHAEHAAEWFGRARQTLLDLQASERLAPSDLPHIEQMTWFERDAVDIAASLTAELADAESD